MKERRSWKLQNILHGGTIFRYLEKLFLSCGRKKFSYYVWLKEKPVKRNFASALKHMEEAEGILCTQIFQELYYQADFNCGGRLSVHVTFMLDEFSNVALPDDYCSLLSIMRSGEISSVIIIQDLAQIKALFKDTWETIPGNCNGLFYLGGNEQSTHEYISKLLGMETIDKNQAEKPEVGRETPRGIMTSSEGIPTITDI